MIKLYIHHSELIKFSKWYSLFKTENTLQKWVGDFYSYSFEDLGREYKAIYLPIEHYLHIVDSKE